MPNPLLSPYRGGENRVTSSIMAVFERIDLELVREILAAATEAGELRAVTFENQVSGPGAVADARIAGHFEWLFETKTVRGAYTREGHSADQLRAYVAQLTKNVDALLFVVTPDSEQPELVAEASEEVGVRILWTSFGRLRDAIEVISARLFSEQTRFLLAELIDLFEVDGLLSTDDTVIVAARSGLARVSRERGVRLPAGPLVPPRRQPPRVLRRGPDPDAHPQDPRPIPEHRVQRSAGEDAARRRGRDAGRRRREGAVAWAPEATGSPMASSFSRGVTTPTPSGSRYRSRTTLGPRAVEAGRGRSPSATPVSIASGQGHVGPASYERPGRSWGGKAQVSRVSYRLDSLVLHSPGSQVCRRLEAVCAVASVPGAMVSTVGGRCPRRMQR